MFIELMEYDGSKFIVNTNKIVGVYDVSWCREMHDYKSDVLLVTEGKEGEDSFYLADSYEEIKEKLGVK